MVKKKSAFAKQLLKKGKSAKRARAIPLRNLWKDGVTYSFLDEFQVCREQARLSYVEGYRERGMKEYFEFGNCIHNCIEAHGKAKCGPINFNLILNKYRDARKKELNAAERVTLSQMVETARIMWPAYVEFWQNQRGMEYLDDCQFVALEEDFKVPHELEDGTVVFLRGRIDGLLRYKKQLWLMENKTKSIIDDRITDALPHDLQTTIYCHVVEQKYGEPVAGILYNVIRRPGLRLNKERDVELLLSRIRTAVAETPEEYFLRWNIYLDPGDTHRAIERTLNPLLRNVVLWWREIEPNLFDPFSIPNRVHHYMSPKGLYTQYGKSQYFDILTTGNDANFTRRER